MIDEKKYDLMNQILDGECLEQIDQTLEKEITMYKTYVKAYFLSKESYTIVNKYKKTIISKILIDLEMEE